MSVACCNKHAAVRACVRAVQATFLFFLWNTGVATTSAGVGLRGGSDKPPNGPPAPAGIKPSRPLIALKQSVLSPDDLFPSEPPPGHLDREWQGYLRPKDTSQEAETLSACIPNILHRIIFLGSQRDITEEQLLRAMDPNMLEAYQGWKNVNTGVCFKLYNLAAAEAYIAEHFDSRVLAAFMKLEPYAYKSDLFRYLVLYHEGGWYVDLKLGQPSDFTLALGDLLDRLAVELSVTPDRVGFVGTGQNMVWNVPGAEGAMNAFLAAKPRYPALGDTIVRIVDEIHLGFKGKTPWSLTGPYALYVGLGKRKNDGKTWRDFNGQRGAALMRFGFDEWHLPKSDTVVVKKASRGECGGGWKNIGGNNYVDMWFSDQVFSSASTTATSATSSLH